MTLTHASWFSGVGGLDMGLEAAGWETVSFSEIDSYASAVLAHRWPGVPNLGSIVDVAGASFDGPAARLDAVHDIDARHPQRPAARRLWHDAFLWTGGFPCQDLSVAGKRRGIVEGSRSGLAITFLDLVERHRPPAIILENVPGLLSSHAGRDFGALLGRLGELGYWWAYRVLDARYFGVPQRRRRVFIVALHAGIGATADSPAEVLSVGSRCDRHPATGGQAGPGVAAGTHVGTLDTSLGHHGGAWGDQAVAAGHVVAAISENQRAEVRLTDYSRQLTTGGGKPGQGYPAVLVGPSPDPRGVREADGLAGRLDDRAELELVQGGESSYHQRDRVYGDLAPALDAYGDTPSDAPMVAIQPFVKVARPHGPDGDGERWAEEQTAPTLSDFDLGSDVRSVVNVLGTDAGAAELLPDGLDSHRYRCCGNGVVAPVAEFVGERLRVVVERLLAERAA